MSDPGGPTLDLDTEDNKVSISEAKLRAMMTEAAAEGARRALKDAGFENFTSADALELVNLLSMWRETKTTIWQTVVKTSTAAILFILVVGVAAHFKLLKVFGA